MKNPLYAHSYIKYKCRDCKREWLMFCIKGIEDGPKSKIAPSPIRCSCGGLAFQHGHVQTCMVWRKIEQHDSYFENYKDVKHGIPVLRGKIHEINKAAKAARENQNTEVQKSESNG